MEEEAAQQQQQQQQQPELLATQNEKVLPENYKNGGESSPHVLAQPGSWNFPGFFGKHKMQAAISQLNNQINIIQEELEELETIGESSTVCKNVISSVESIPDPLLPLTKGSVDADCDRWFGGGSHNLRSHKRWI